jgi:hypothetical protein
MQDNRNDASLEELREIRSIMDRSSKFVSLSGMSGVWAGLTACAGAFVAYLWLRRPEFSYIGQPTVAAPENFDNFTIKLMFLGLAVFTVAFSGAFYFTYKKARRHSHTLLTNASKQLLLHLFYPLFAGGVFCVSFIYNGCGMFVGPACLTFYGLALISASRHTLSDIRYLGMLEVALGCCSLFLPGFGLYFWAFGFGVLHILYGAMMWNKYDK